MHKIASLATYNFQIFLGDASPWTHYVGLLLSGESCLTFIYAPYYALFGACESVC